MSNSLDVGRTRENNPDDDCKKAEDKKHNWESHGAWPSRWWTCLHCNVSKYSK